MPPPIRTWCYPRKPMAESGCKGLPQLKNTLHYEKFPIIVKILLLTLDTKAMFGRLGFKALS